MRTAVAALAVFAMATGSAAAAVSIGDKLTPFTLKDAAGKDVFVGINSNKQEAPAEIAAHAGVDKDWGGAVPATLIFDRGGRRVAMLAGEQTRVQIERALDRLKR